MARPANGPSAHGLFGPHRFGVNRTRLGQTKANEMLQKLLDTDDRDLKNILQVAQEYADHPDLAGKSIPAGDRLMRQLEFAVEEFSRIGMGPDGEA